MNKFIILMHLFIIANVGIHVRRGDMMNEDKVEYGYTTPDEAYFAHAMRYFVDLFERIQFIVARLESYL